MEATIRIYSPSHKGPVYEVNLPFYDVNIKEKYWIGFCFRGGRGVNYHGVTVSDPSALYLNKPSVNKDCILDNQRVATIGISQPQNVDVTILSQDFVKINWDEPRKNGGSPIAKYRLFI